MSILIRGMEMPRPKLAGMVAVYNAYIVVRHNGEAKIVVDNEDKSDSTEYPLVLVPEHGRLIDTDAVSLEGGPYEYDEWCKWALTQYQDAPTIIEAEK